MIQFKILISRHTNWGVVFALIGTIILVSSNSFHTFRHPLIDYLFPFILYLCGIFFTTLGSLIKENHFRKFEMSKTRFFCIDKMVEFIFLSVIVYPLVSLIKCDSFDRYFVKICTNNILDHPVIAFNTFFIEGTNLHSPIILSLFLLLLVLLFFFSSFTKLKVTKVISKNHKSILQHCKVILIFTAEIFIFDLQNMQNGTLKVKNFLMISILKCFGFLCFVVASVLIYEIYPIKIFKLHKDFGRYYFQFEHENNKIEENIDINQNISQIDSIILTNSRFSRLTEDFRKSNMNQMISDL